MQNHSQLPIWLEDWVEFARLQAGGFFRSDRPTSWWRLDLLAASEEVLLLLPRPSVEVRLLLPSPAVHPLLQSVVAAKRRKL